MAPIVISDLSESTPIVVGGRLIIALDMPVMFEDEGQEEMGDSASHHAVTRTLFHCIAAHLLLQPQYCVYSNLDVLYHPIKRAAYFSADVMVVEPFQRLPDELYSYKIGEDGPAPILAIEVLSERSDQQGDLTLKPDIYSELEVREYLLVDTTGKFLKERLLMLRRQPDGSWLDSQDADGGVTSALGFRVIIEDDEDVRVLNAKTGQKYLRHDEAEAAEKVRWQDERELKAAQARIRELEAENARLKKKRPPKSKD